MRRPNIRLTQRQALNASVRYRFDSRREVILATGCIEWRGLLNSRGYGKLYIGGPPGAYVLAHRLAWVIERGEIPDAMTVDHVTCGNPRCTNVAHLELVSLSENTRRSNAKRRAARMAEVTP